MRHLLVVAGCSSACCGNLPFTCTGLYMPKVADIQLVSLTLEIDGKQALFVLLAEDGSINRLGTGSIDNAENDLFIGRTEEPLIARAKQALTDHMLDYMGGYDVPVQEGAACRLAIVFRFANGEENGFGFRYGAESDGPPEEIIQFVMAAVTATEPWYNEQKAMRSGGRPAE